MNIYADQTSQDDARIAVRRKSYDIATQNCGTHCNWLRQIYHLILSERLARLIVLYLKEARSVLDLIIAFHRAWLSPSANLSTLRKK